MRISLRWVVCGLAGCMALALEPAASRADFLYFAGNPTGYQSTLDSLGRADGNVLFNAPGLVRQGITVQGQAAGGGVINLSAGEILAITAVGQARVEAVDGDFTALRLAPADPNTVFRALSWEINALNGPGGTTFLTLDAAAGPGAGGTASIRLSQGLTFVGIIATGGDAFTAAEIAGTVPISDIRQVRTELAPAGSPPPPGTESASVPEPASVVLVAVGLALLAAAGPLRRLARPGALRAEEGDPSGTPRLASPRPSVARRWALARADVGMLSGEQTARRGRAPCGMPTPTRALASHPGKGPFLHLSRGAC